MDVGSVAALYAGSMLVKKTFEAVAQRSLSSLFTRLHLQVLQKELESWLQVLSLPVNSVVDLTRQKAVELEDFSTFEKDTNAKDEVGAKQKRVSGPDDKAQGTGRM